MSVRMVDGAQGKIVLPDVNFWVVTDWRLAPDRLSAEVFVKFGNGNPDLAGFEEFRSEMRCLIRNGECQGWKRHTKVAGDKSTDVLEKQVVTVADGLDQFLTAAMKVPGATAVANIVERSNERIEAMLLSSGVMNADIGGTVV